MISLIYGIKKWYWWTYLQSTNRVTDVKSNLMVTWGEVLLFNHSVVSDSATPGTAACQASLSFTNSQSLIKLMSIESVIPSNHLVLCSPLLLLFSIFPSIRVFFSDESALHIRWPKCWSSRLSISPSSEYSGLLSFRIDGLSSLQSK